MISWQQRLAGRITPLTLVLLVWGALLLCYNIVVLLATPPGHDQSWYAVAAQRFVGGAKLYGPEIAETNPPFILWFSSMPVFMAHGLHISSSLALRLMVIAMIFGSTAWCVRLLRLSPSSPDGLVRGLLGAAILTAEFWIGVHDFGQREQLLIILAVPYILAASSCAVARISRVERIALGVAIGMGICFKPQHVLILVALEVLLALYYRSLRRALTPEFAAAVLTCVLYVGLVRLLTPEYLSQTVPLLLDTYWAYGTSTVRSLASTTKPQTLGSLFALILCIVMRRRLRDPLTLMAFFLCSLAASVAFDIQHADWTYHRYPQDALFFLGISYLLIDLFIPVIGFLQRDRRIGSLSAIAALLLLVLPLRSIANDVNDLDPDPPPPRHGEFETVLDNYESPATMFVFSTSVVPLSSMSSHGFDWGGRFPSLWLLPAIVINQQNPPRLPANFRRISSERLAALARLQQVETAEDLDRYRPSVVLVEHCTLEHPCQAIEGLTFEMIPWFSESPEFVAAWSHYRKEQGPPFFDLYTRIP